MKRHLLIALLACLATLGMAQPTLDQNGVGTIGNVYYLATQDTLLPPNLVGSSGANQIWDFTTLQVYGLDTITFVDPVATGYSNDFPNANLAIQQSSLNNGYGFLEVTSNFMDLDGFVGDLLGTGSPIIAHQTPPLRVSQFPFTYNDSFSNTSTLDVSLDASSFGIPFVDSARFKNIQVRNLEGSAYGTLNLPNASYNNVLRIKEINQQTDSTWIHTIFGGWQLFSDSAYTDSTFSWSDNAKGYLLAQAEYIGGVLDNVQFQDYILVGMEGPVNPAFSVSPNPANDHVMVRTDGSRAIITISDLQGRMVMTQTLETSQTTLDLQKLTRGCYLYSIRNEEGKLNASGKLLLTR